MDGHRGQQISIHALREEGDVSSGTIRCSPRYFYPRPPRGGRPAAAHVLSSSGIFLSTPSARRATCCGVGVNLAVEISIHALREEGDAVALAAAAKLVISIHALREEGDTKEQVIGDVSFEFLSTPSARRATHRGRQGAPVPPISIHALREEGDFQRMSRTRTDIKFLSTPSARRATQKTA